MPRFSAAARLGVGAVIVGGLAACSVSNGSTGSASLSGSPAGASSPAVEPSEGALASADASTSGRPALPVTFPVMTGAVAVELPNDPTLIARWTIAEVGPTAYDYYASALPAAAYPIVGLYPAEHAALIRFQGPGGAIWQLLAEQIGAATRITVQTDRP